MKNDTFKSKLKSLLPEVFLECYHRLRIIVKVCISSVIFWICRLFPLKNKVLVSAFKGQKYGDSPQYIIEKLHELDPTLEFVWLKRDETDFKVPDWVRTVSYYLKIRTIYEYSTAKVWLDTHRMRKELRKRKGQLCIELWHGGLGVKKLELDVPAFEASWGFRKELQNTNRIADVFISQSDFLSDIFRRAFGYQGPIWKCGFAKNDILFSSNADVRRKVRKALGIAEDIGTILYAPSFRDEFYEQVDVSPYSIDFARLKEAVKKRFGGNWIVLVRWHPLFAQSIAEIMNLPTDVIDTTQYQDMQELIMAVDAMVSDYSSSVFDAALTGMPCFMFATDVDKYKAHRGLYFEMDELPFPFAKNNDELMSNILNFDPVAYHAKWEQFTKQTGLYESGHAADDIANKIMEFIKTGHTEWK